MITARHPSAARWCYLQQRAAQPLAAAADQEDLGRSVQRLHNASCTELQRHLLSSLVPDALACAAAFIAPHHQVRTVDPAGDGWEVGLRAMLICLQQTFRFEGGSAGQPLVDRIVVLLCEASGVPTGIGELESHEVVRAIQSRRSLILACGAVAVARAFSSHLGPGGWHAVLRTLLVLDQLALAPSLISTVGRAPAPAGSGDPAGGAEAVKKLENTVDETARTHSTAEAASGDQIDGAAASADDNAAGGALDTVERMLAAPWPDPHSTPPWEFIGALRTLIAEPLQPTDLLGTALASLPPLPSAATAAAHESSRLAASPSSTSDGLWHALIRVVDESMHAAFALHRPSAADAAGKALSLLIACIEQVGHTSAPSWAPAAVYDRAARALATPHCPPPIHAAASHGVSRMRDTTGIAVHFGSSE